MARREPRTLFPQGGEVTPLLGKLVAKEGLPPRQGDWLSAGAPETVLLHQEPPEPVPTPSPEEIQALLAEGREIAGLAAQREQLERELEVLKDTQARLEEAMRRYTDGVADLERRVKELPSEQAEDTVELAFVIAKAIVGHELGTDRTRAAALVGETLRMLDATRDVTVRIHPQDLEILRQNQPELASSGNLVFVEDASLTSGGCIVETPKRIVDASVETKLESVRERLAEMLREGEPAAAEGGA